MTQEESQQTISPEPRAIGNSSNRLGLLLLLLLIAAIVAAIAWVGVAGYLAHSRATASKIIANDLKRIYIYLFNYGTVHKALPLPIARDEDGKELSSWRWQITRYFEADPPWGDGPVPNLKAHWQSDEYQTARGWRPYVYCWLGDKHGGETNVFAITGEDTAMGADAPIDFSLETPKHVVVLMEVADSHTHWMQPGDYDVADLLAATGSLGDTVHGVLNDRIHVLFADGEVWALSPKTPMDAVKPFLTVTAAKAANRDTLAAYRVD